MLGLQSFVGVDAASPVRRPTCFGASATIVGTNRADRLVGTRGPDVIVGLGGEDVILGHDGRDRICGGRGDDELDGRYGSDFLDGEEGHDAVAGGPGHDLLVGGPGRDVLQEADGRGTLVGGPGGDRLSGGDGDGDWDHLFGGPANDSLHGGLGGQDLLFGGTGNDVFAEGVVSYEFSATPVSAVIDATVRSGARGEGSDHFTAVEGLIGSDHDDALTGGEGAEIFQGRGGDDAIVAGAGDDEVDGGPGSDELDGGDGADLLTFHDAPSSVTASLRDGTATDTGSDVLARFEDLGGSFFDDELTGDDGPNMITGSHGPDTVFALGGNDDIELASGGDAGDGQDTCSESFGVASCEIDSIPEPFPVPFVDEPIHLEDVDRVGLVRGGTLYARERVLVGIRRMTSNGCRWWNADRARFVPGVCGVFQGSVVPVRRGEWSLRVDVALVPGSYRIGVNWPETRGGFFSCFGFYAPMCVDLIVRNDS